MIIVSDTSVLSNLAVIEQLQLLQQLYNQVIIPQAVRNELSNASPENINIRAVVALSWIEIRLVKNTVLVETLLHDRELDQGEAEAIALALELPAKRLLIDERLGRREATRLGIPITGVLGILIAAKTEGLLPLGFVESTLLPFRLEITGKSTSHHADLFANPSPLFKII